MTIILPLRPVRRIMRSAGIKRCSWDANIRMARILRDICLRITSDARKFTKHAGRKTLYPEDIDLAYEQFRK